MKGKEFNLSEKILIGRKDCKDTELDVKDVKEFIRRLKEYIELRTRNEKGGYMIRVLELKRKINKLVGDKLK